LTFSELVRLLEQGGFRIVREKGSVRYYARPGHPRLVRSRRGLAKLSYRQWGSEDGGALVIELKYSLVAEATEDPTFFGFHSPDLEGFTGIGHSVEDCLYQAKWGMQEHIALLRERGLAIPKPNPSPTIVIQNERRLKAVV
jgi:predicted RNase H-like HicB family nuclease